MPDREKIIKGVHDARRYLEDREWVDKSVGVHIDALNDALDALLKEQKTRKGYWIEDETETYTENHDTWECSECHEPFTLTEGTPEENEFYFCPRCGADMR